MNVTTRSQVTCIPGANLKGKSTMSHERWRDPSTQWRVGLVTAVYAVVGTMAGALAAAFVGHFFVAAIVGALLGAILGAHIESR
jgi:hypothetical protein